MLRTEGKRTKERKQRNATQAADTNAEKRRKEDKGKEEKRKATHAADTNAENRRKEGKEMKIRGKQHTL